MMQQNIITDLGTWSKIPNKILTELINKTNLCIGSAIRDAKLANEDVVILNIGIGTLSINIPDMQCKFLPSKDLKTAIKASLSEPVDPLELALEQALIEKLLSVCDEVL